MARRRQGQTRLTAFGFSRYKLHTESRSARRGLQPRVEQRNNSQPTTLLQYRLTDYSFQCKASKPCYINMLPAELLMRIVEPLPFVTSLWTRVHAKPSRLPRHDDEAALTAEASPYLFDFYSGHAGHARCIAEALFPHGCVRFCDYKPWDYLELLLVCKHWRSVIEASPHFWRHVVVNNELTVAKSLRLSGVTPLKVTVDGSTNWPSQRAFLSVLEELPRIGELKVGFASLDSEWQERTAAQLFHALVSRSAPSLRALHWNAYNKQVVPTQQWAEKVFPSLETIAMYDVDLKSPCSLLVPTLTQLTLSRCSPPWSTASELLSLLSRMPKLETLFLWDLPDIPDFEEDRFQIPDTHHAPITFPNLNLLNLQGSYRYVCRLLPMLQVPHSLSTLNLTYAHRDYGLDLPNEARKTYAFFNVLGQAIPDDEAFHEMEYKIDFDSGELEIAISDDTRRFHWRHTWDVGDNNLAEDILRFLQNVYGPFQTRYFLTVLHITVIGSFDTVPGGRLTPHACFKWLREHTIANLRLVNDAAAYVIPWMRRCLHDDGSAQLPFAGLRLIGIAETSLINVVDEDTFDESDILFKHLWLYLHDQRPMILLSDVDLTHRMEKCLYRMIGPWLQIGSVTHVDGPRVRMEYIPHGKSKLHIAAPSSTQEVLIETPYNS
ncbi:unnamed protein product [Peniophora sp. CBMAI 1063]|nr:unnamed protein product [Peniophora sp. CBMAI 1063]